MWKLSVVVCCVILVAVDANICSQWKGTCTQDSDCCTDGPYPLCCQAVAYNTPVGKCSSAGYCDSQPAPCMFEECAPGWICRHSRPTGELYGMCVPFDVDWY